MDYCTNCGEALTGAKRFCAKCGFEVPSSRGEVPDPDLDRTSLMGVPDAEEEGTEEGRGSAGATREEPPAAPEPVEKRPPHLKKEEPRQDLGFVPSCDVCGGAGEAKCLFCEKGLCKQHMKKMAVLVNGIASSREVPSCEDCSKKRVGKVPTAPEAKEADFLYAIKPYHEWGLIE
jgi:hypothetical protein